MTSALATASAASPSESIELAAGYTGVIVVGVSMVMGVIDLVVLVMSSIPALRNTLGFRSRGLQSAINRSKSHQRAVPLLNVAPPIAAAPIQLPPNPPPPVRPNIPTTNNTPQRTKNKPHRPQRLPDPPPAPAPPPAEELSAAEIQMLKEIIESVDEYDRKKAAAASKKNGVDSFDI